MLAKLIPPKAIVIPVVIFMPPWVVKSGAGSYFIANRDMPQFRIASKSRAFPVPPDPYRRIGAFLGPGTCKSFDVSCRPGRCFAGFTMLPSFS